MSKIIAELGVNWSGDINIAKDMITQSKRAGADFVKFQMFNKEVIKDSKYKDELSEMILDFEKINILRGYAFQNHIAFGVSIMYPEALEMIDNKIGVPVDFIKIRCQDHQNEDIARPAVKFCDKWNIPLLISTEKPIHNKDYFRYNLYHTSHAKYLYCVPKYPPELTDIYDSCINPDIFDGFSSHFLSKYIPMIAVARHLKYIEVHVKKDNNCIDNNVSLTFEELNEICILKKILLNMG